MFDLKYYEKLKQNGYREYPIVQMLTVYEDIELMNVDREYKMKEHQTRSDELFNIMKEKQIVQYPCTYQEHVKNKFKIKEIAKQFPNLYMYFITQVSRKLELVTESQSPNIIKETITKKVFGNSNN